MPHTTTLHTLIQELALLDEPVRDAYLDSLTADELDDLMYNWQHWARPEQLTPDGDWNIWLILSGRGWGKALALDTPLPTLAGWTTMGDVQVGDTLFDENGNPTKVTFVTPVMHDHTCYDVVFSDGTVITADAEHQWLTWTHAARKAAARRIAIPQKHQQQRAYCNPSIVTTEQIKDTLLQGKRGDINHSIDVCKPLQCPIADLPVDPYVLGAWLGDGHSASAAITTADEDILLEIALAGYSIHPYKISPNTGQARTYGIGSVDPVRDPASGRMMTNDSLHSKLKALGVWKNKHVPVAYLRASIEQRVALLQGLMDTDGSVTLKGHCEFMSTVEPLSLAVYELCASLGMKPVIATERATLYGKDCGPRYRVTFTPHVPVFRLLRKIERQHTGKSQKERNNRRYIVDVRERPSVPVRCIQVDSASHLFLAGRSCIPTHNTRTLAEDFKAYGLANPNSRMAIVAPTYADARDTCVEGESGLLRILKEKDVKAWNRSLGELVLTNGTRYKLFSSEEPERLRGPQHHRAWCEELCAWKYPQETWDNLMFGLRLGVDPRVVISTTPKKIKLLLDLMQRVGKTVHLTKGSTFDNAANLAGAALDELKRRYLGTRTGRQELFAEILDDIDGALWKRDWIERNRVVKHPELKRIVVAIDPPATSLATSEDPAEAGIIVAGVGDDGHGYMLADYSMIGTPDEWASAALTAYNIFEADCIVGEINNGGEMIEAIIRSKAKEKGMKQVTFKSVRATRGKQLRAEPISSLCQRDLIHHVGTFPDTEDQMCNWVPGQRSPDRLDGHVWAFTELMITNEPTADELIADAKRRVELANQRTIAPAQGVVPTQGMLPQKKKGWWET